MALLGSLAIHPEFGPVIQEVITHGPPLVGNPAFTDAYDAVFQGKYTGLTSGADWVPAAPWKWLN